MPPTTGGPVDKRAFSCFPDIEKCVEPQTIAPKAGIAIQKRMAKLGTLVEDLKKYLKNPKPQRAPANEEEQEASSQEDLVAQPLDLIRLSLNKTRHQLFGHMFSPEMNPSLLPKLKQETSSSSASHVCKDDREAERHGQGPEGWRPYVDESLQ